MIYPDVINMDSLKLVPCGYADSLISEEDVME
jgi:hypothetical protein